MEHMGLDQINLDSVKTVKDLANLLQQLRLLRIDRMSYAKMADSIENEISRSEMSRILTGSDFPSRAQLHFILDILKMSRTDRQGWDAMWDRLAQDLYAADGWQRKPLDLSTRISDQGIQIVHQDVQMVAEGYQDKNSFSGFNDDLEKRRSAAIIESAYEEADRIVRSARAAAENEREALIQDARKTASNLIDKFMAELTLIIQDNQAKIARIVGDAEEKLKTVIATLNDSVEDNHRTSGELRQLVDDVHVSMGEIRAELAQVREETESVKEGYGVARASSQPPAANEGKRKRPRFLSSRLFSDDRKVPPAVIGEQLGSADGDGDDNSPPWLKDY